MFKKFCLPSQNYLPSFLGGQLKNNKLYSTNPVPKHVDVIQKFIGCTKREALDSLNNYGNVQSLTEPELLKRLGVLQQTGIADIKETKCLALAKHHHATLKNRILSMQECGFKHEVITSTTVKKFLTLIQLKIYTLKRMQFIDKDTDVYKELLEHAQLLNHYSPVDDSVDIKSLKLETLKLLLKNEIGMSDEQLNISYFNVLKRLKYKSIRLIRQNIEVAKNIGLTPYRICRNPFVLCVDPENTLKMIEEIQDIGGVDIKMCLSLFPKIMASTSENVRETLECLKEFKFSNEAIQRSLPIFTLSPKTVRDRLNDLEKYEYFACCKHHPNALQLVFYYKTVKNRLNLINEVNIAHPTVSTITTTREKLFAKYFEHGSQRQFGTDILKYICGELEGDKLEFHEKIKSLQAWRFVPIVEIAKNIKILRQNGFNNEEISNNLQIIFYHRSRIIEGLSSLHEKSGLECCKDDNGQIKRHLILPLVLYFIENKYNFSSHSFFAGDEEGNETYSDISIPRFKVVDAVK